MEQWRKDARTKVSIIDIEALVPKDHLLRKTVRYAFCKRFPLELATEIFKHILNESEKTGNPELAGSFSRLVFAIFALFCGVASVPA